jgi:hypothetical protein
MKPRTRLLLMALLIAAWAVPAVRVVRFCLDAWRVYQEEQSLNAWNDVRHSAWLIGAYSVSLAFPAVLLLLRRLNGFLGFVLVAACLFIAGDVIRRHPEEVIVLFPSMNPSTYSLDCACDVYCWAAFHVAESPQPTTRFTEWGPREAFCQFGDQQGTTIRELIRRPQRLGAPS